MQALEEYLLSTEIEVPVYFAEESEDLEYLVSDVIKNFSVVTDAAASVCFRQILPCLVEHCKVHYSVTLQQCLFLAIF